MIDTATLEKNFRLIEEAAADAGASLVGHDENSLAMTFAPAGHPETFVMVTYDTLRVWVWFSADDDWREARVEWYGVNPEGELYAEVLRALHNPFSLAIQNPEAPDGWLNTLRKVTPFIVAEDERRRRRRYLTMRSAALILVLVLGVYTNYVYQCLRGNLQVDWLLFWGGYAACHAATVLIAYTARSRAKKLPPFNEFTRKP